MEPIDPMAAIDRLGWTGPIAIAETSARSCATPLYLEVPGTGGATLYVHAFLRDHPPIGTWIAGQGVLAPALQSLFNTLPCSGLQDPSGAWKPEMLAIGQPERPRSGWVSSACSGSLQAALERAGEKNLQFGWQSPKRRATQRPSGR